MGLAGWGGWQKMARTTEISYYEDAKNKFKYKN